MCQERLKRVTSDLPVIPHRFRMCFAIVVQDVDCRSGHTSGSMVDAPFHSDCPCKGLTHLGPWELRALRALMWHLTVHQPPQIALSCVSLLPASALSAKACWTLCPHQATDPGSPAAVQHIPPSACTCSLARDCTAALYAPKGCSAEPHCKGKAWPLLASHLALLLCKERLQLVQGRLRDVLQAAHQARRRLAACAGPLEAALRC